MSDTVKTFSDLAALRRLFLMALLVCCAASVGTRESAARVLFGDSFNSPDSPDVSMGKQEPGRQSGDLAFLDLWEQGVADIHSQALRLNSVTGSIIPDHDFTDAAITSAGGFVVEVDLNPAVLNGDGTQFNWGALAIGLPEAASRSQAVLAEYSPKAFAIGLRDNGRYFVYGDGNVRIDGAVNPPDDDLVFDAVPTGAEWYHLKLTVLTTSFDVEEIGAVMVEVSGELDEAPGLDTRLLTIDDDRDNNGSTTSYRFDWPTGENYISVESFADGDFDNLRIATPLAGDTNDDGTVDIDDLNNVRNSFGSSGVGDANGDGRVNIDDLNAVRNNFGASVPSMSAPVPEPASAALALMAAAGVWLCRRW